MEAVLQLEEPCQISYIDIGTVWCSHLELRLGCSDWPQSREFVPLVRTVALMTPLDCRLERSINTTKMFSKSDFSESTAEGRWDRLQIVCRQSFRKDVQFGVTFVRIKCPNMDNRTVVETRSDRQAQDKKLDINVSAIHKHFFGAKKDNREDDMLKHRLLRMSASADNGTDLALSRPARLVMKASENAGPFSPMQRQNNSTPNRKLFSEHVASKNGPLIEEEIKDFLPGLQISTLDIDEVTVADLRHKFERKKRCKLTVEEKHKFSALCQDFICDLFDNISKETPTNAITDASAMRTASTSKSSIGLLANNKNPHCNAKSTDIVRSGQSSTMTARTTPEQKSGFEREDSSPFNGRRNGSLNHNETTSLAHTSSPAQAKPSSKKSLGQKSSLKETERKTNLKKEGQKARLLKYSVTTAVGIGDSDSTSEHSDSSLSSISYEESSEDVEETSDNVLVKKKQTAEDVNKSYTELYKTFSPNTDRSKWSSPGKGPSRKKRKRSQVSLDSSTNETIVDLTEDSASKSAWLSTVTENSCTPKGNTKSLRMTPISSKGAKQIQPLDGSDCCDEGDRQIQLLDRSDCCDEGDRQIQLLDRSDCCDEETDLVKERSTPNHKSHSSLKKQNGETGKSSPFYDPPWRSSEPVKSQTTPRSTEPKQQTLSNRTCPNRIPRGSSPNQIHTVRGGRIYRMFTSSTNKPDRKATQKGFEDIYSDLLGLSTHNSHPLDSGGTVLSLKFEPSAGEVTADGVSTVKGRGRPGGRGTAGTLMDGRRGGRGPSGRSQARTPPPQVLCDSCQIYIPLDMFQDHELACDGFTMTTGTTTDPRATGTTTDPRTTGTTTDPRITGTTTDPKATGTTTGPRATRGPDRAGPQENFHELEMDDDIVYAQCPICLQRFPQDVLIVHASECGL